MSDTDETIGTTETILIYQMGKTGSQTIERTVRALRPEADIVRTHFLEPRHYDPLIADDVEVGTSPEFRASVVRQKEEAAAAMALLHSRRGKTVKVVSACREPVAHYVASCFQNFSFLVPGSEHLAVDACVTRMRNRLLSDWRGMADGHDAESTRDRFMRMLLRIGHHWFDEELRDVLGVDVYAVPFQPDQGYVVFSQQGMDVLVYRFEDGPRAMERGLAELFGIDSVSVLNRNLSSAKDYHAAYAEFRRYPGLPPEFLDERYDSQCVRHFYSNSEVAHFRRGWSQTDQYREVDRPEPSNHVAPARSG